MPSVIYYVATSLDGFIATSDGKVDWLAPFESAGEDYGYTSFYASIDAVLVGRHTYEQSLKYPVWPFANKPCWVFSQTLKEKARPGLRFTAAPPAELLNELNDWRIKRAWLVGGSQLAAAFRNEGLISEYIISVIPVMLGAGIPLFASPCSLQRLRLLDAKTYPNGVTQLRYMGN